MIVISMNLRISSQIWPYPLHKKREPLVDLSPIMTGLNVEAMIKKQL